ncbi:MAG: methionyl-tRNA formyltransferase [Candidatus Cloacimonetes bacterium]|nr:methionyl-tRNA formyltransferase [Candidatus Cloacimonadota bacterium]
MRVVFAGSSSFGLPILKMLEKKAFLKLVISQPDRPAGRSLKLTPCPIAEYANQQGMELFQPEDINQSQSIEKIRAMEPDLLVTASYGGMIRRELRRLPKREAINLHPSLLPRHRGATPIQSSLLCGENLTGTTIFRLTARLDAGPILAQKELPILDSDSHGSLHDKLALLSADLLEEILPLLETGSLAEHTQNDAEATYSAKLGREDLILDWNKPASEIRNRIRAFSPQPGALAFWKGKGIQILAADLHPQKAQGKPGTFAGTIKNQGVLVNCQDNCLLLRQLRPAGKKQMDAWVWQLGARLVDGDGFDLPQTSKPSREES